MPLNDGREIFNDQMLLFFFTLILGIFFFKRQKKYFAFAYVLTLTCCVIWMTVLIIQTLRSSYSYDWSDDDTKKSADCTARFGASYDYDKCMAGML